MKPIKQSVINTFKRVGLSKEVYELMDEENVVVVYNRFGGGSCETTPLIARPIDWVYSTNNAIEMGTGKVRISDFDRIRYFILEQDPNAYSTCID